MPQRPGLALVLVAAVVGALSATFVSSTATATRGAAKPEALSVGIVDVVRLVSGLAEVQEAQARLEALKAEFDKELQVTVSEIRKIEGDLELIKERASPEAIRLRARLSQLNVTARAQREGLQGVIDAEEGEQLRSMFAKIQASADRLAPQLGYDLILMDDRANMPPERDAKGNRIPITGRQVNEIVLSRRVLTAGPKADVTQALIDFMNNEFKAGKP